jgi:hypothetical protein
VESNAVCAWASVFLLPICVPSDYELEVYWPLLTPDFPGYEEDEVDEEDEESELLLIAA